MQEAYLVVDYERLNFTIGQAIHQNRTSDIVEISTIEISTDKGGGISAGAIAGIVIGILLVLSLLFGLAFFYRQRLRQVFSRKDKYANFGTEKNPAEVSSNQIYQLHDNPIAHELSAYPEAELEGSPVIVEADSKEIQPPQSRVVILGPLS